MRSKDRNILVILCVLSFLGGIHKFFYETGTRWDLFLFYDYETSSGLAGKLASGITYELSYMIEVMVLFVLWRSAVVLISTRNIISPFMWIAVVDVLDYICFYKQMSCYKLPLLMILMLYYNFPNLWTEKINYLKVQKLRWTKK